MLKFILPLLVVGLGLFLMRKEKRMIGFPLTVIGSIAEAMVVSIRIAETMV